VSYVRDYLDKAMLILRAHTGNVRYIDCKLHSACGLVDGQELSLGALGSAVLAWQAQASQLLRNDLLEGQSQQVSRICSQEYSLTSWRTERDSVSSVYLKSACGLLRMLQTFSNTSRERVRFPEGGFIPGQRISTNIGYGLSTTNGDSVQGTGVSGAFGSTEIEETILRSFNRTNLHKQIQSTQHLQEILPVLMHVMGEAPARAAEMATYPYTNGPVLYETST